MDMTHTANNYEKIDTNDKKIYPIEKPNHHRTMWQVKFQEKDHHNIKVVKKLSFIPSAEPLFKFSAEPM